MKMHAIASAKAACPLRSSFASERRPHQIMPTKPTAYGIAVIKPHLQLRQSAEVLNDLRQPEADAVIGGNCSEINECQRQHPSVGQRLTDS